MKGHPDVIAQLQRLLANELAAIDQYFIHSRMYEDWGYLKLFERIDHETTEEKDHASMLIRRMLFLEATPDLSQRDGLRVGATVPQMLANDLQLEYDVAAALKEAIVCCEREQDFQTRQVLEQLLRDTEEDHAYWLEQQLRLIEQVGLQNYLQAQM
ncbi:bacterioferritin [Thiocapsa imhoffii]|uniref:Bacterioferritin n=1 Tax=Thiocapsa imhoffii TaxID=382777 RepID=A0A9X0WGH9_9GAMM|nr:bacterioferritin [Thiocapsa imhoffii]MBK1644168.1 bacterioferritin [Thiocapsa imhoffii]